jgi:hypothetical protein
MRYWPTSKAVIRIGHGHAGQFDRKSTPSFRSCAERIRLRCAVGRPFNGQEVKQYPDQFAGFDCMISNGFQSMRSTTGSSTG